MMSIILVKGVKKVKRATRTDLFFKEKKILIFFILRQNARKIFLLLSLFFF